eukprot:TRINITY_DN3259_c0_g1_i3.p1 TRINITY_DN3259_c0_g1~~TRINITY_DN3259_c0_g1_i3.p1  ORF type:complete len:1121 (-),score=263.78 TRINITY_DN3259_c0_g1_i3:24-3272(-)
MASHLSRQRKPRSNSTPEPPHHDTLKKSTTSPHHIDQSSSLSSQFDAFPRHPLTASDPSQASVSSPLSPSSSDQTSEHKDAISRVMKLFKKSSLGKKASNKDSPHEDSPKYDDTPESHNKHKHKEKDKDATKKVKDKDPKKDKEKEKEKKGKFNSLRRKHHHRNSDPLADPPSISAPSTPVSSSAPTMPSVLSSTPPNLKFSFESSGSPVLNVSPLQQRSSLPPSPVLSQSTSSSPSLSPLSSPPPDPAPVPVSTRKPPLLPPLKFHNQDQPATSSDDIHCHPNYDAASTDHMNQQGTFPSLPSSQMFPATTISPTQTFFTPPAYTTMPLPGYPSVSPNDSRDVFAKGDNNTDPWASRSGQTTPRSGPSTPRYEYPLPSPSSTPKIRPVPDYEISGASGFSLDWNSPPGTPALAAVSAASPTSLSMMMAGSSNANYFGSNNNSGGGGHNNSMGGGNSTMMFRKDEHMVVGVGNHNNSMFNVGGVEVLPSPRHPLTLRQGQHRAKGRSISDTFLPTASSDKAQVVSEVQRAIESEKIKRNRFQEMSRVIGQYEVMVPISEVQFVRKVGEGAFSEVWEGFLWNGMRVAIKRLKLMNDDELFSERFVREVANLRRANHPNVVLFIAACVSPPCIITEFMSGGTLYDLLHKQKARFSFPIFMKMAVDLSLGMCHLHSLGIVHRDLTSMNVLLDEVGNLKISDLGLSREKQNSEGSATTMTLGGICNPRWRPPEITKNTGGYNEKVDVYCYGLVLWEMLTGEIPFAGLDGSQAAAQVAYTGLRPPLPEDLDAAIGDLIVACWDAEPANRPHFQYILERLQEISWLNPMGLQANPTLHGQAAITAATAAATAAANVAPGTATGNSTSTTTSTTTIIPTLNLNTLSQSEGSVVDSLSSSSSSTTGMTGSHSSRTAKEEAAAAAAAAAIAAAGATQAWGGGGGVPHLYRHAGIFTGNFTNMAAPVFMNTTPSFSHISQQPSKYQNQPLVPSFPLQPLTTKSVSAPNSERLLSLESPAAQIFATESPLPSISEAPLLSLNASADDVSSEMDTDPTTTANEAEGTQSSSSVSSPSSSSLSPPPVTAPDPGGP